MIIPGLQILKDIGALLISAQQTIAVAESVTSGLFQFAFGSTENASQFYQGGITAYNLGQKYKHLSVEPVHAMKVNCVSVNVAEQMAIAVSNMFKSDWGIAITGYASPVPASGNAVFAYSAIAFNQHIITSFKIEQPENIDTKDIQFYYLQNVLANFVKNLQHNL